MEDLERALVLGAVLKRIGNFDTSTLEGRIVLQKTVYLLQSFGLYFGYRFSWYVHGPYSPELTRDAFKVQPVYRRVPTVVFAETRTEERFQEFLGFLSNKKNDADWLEQLSCIHFLRALRPKANKQKIIRAVLNHEPHFTERQCEDAWNYLSEHRLL